jgi:RimJ/RimL family protein N-acetyltransferase
MGPLFPLTLQGPRVRLEALTPAHLDGLLAAAEESRQSYGLTNVPATREAMERYIQTALDEAQLGAGVPLTTVDLQRGQVVGCTRFGSIESWSWLRGEPALPVPVGPDAVEIGWTWLSASAQRTHVNTAAKLLMLTHAFEVWRVRRVTLKTDARNLRSRNAIERIGGKLDGVLRAHMPGYDGLVRDTAFFSMLAAEWPEAKARLMARDSA